MSELDLRARERQENFPVVLRALPARFRENLHAVYAVARSIDDIGDRADGDRTSELEDFRSDLAKAWSGDEPRRTVLKNLKPAVLACGMSREPFDKLIEANLLDQRVSRYSTFEDLLAYCRLSADPIGHLVLAVFDQTSPETVMLSNRVCTALQLLEHWQDVAEDFAGGRIYLPQEDLVAFGVKESELGRASASEEVRALMSFEICRAIDLLESGASITGHLHGWGRVAVAGYVAGGRAAGRGLRRTDGDVLAHTGRSRRHHLDMAFAIIGLLAGPRVRGIEVGA